MEQSRRKSSERSINRQNCSSVCWLILAGFVVPLTGARVILGKANGSDVFSGYVTGAPQYEYWDGESRDRYIATTWWRRVTRFCLIRSRCRTDLPFVRSERG